MVQLRRPPAEPVPLMNDADVETYLQAAAIALGLKLSPDFRAGDRASFEQALAHASLLDTLEIDSHHESAAIFVPVGPDDAP